MTDSFDVVVVGARVAGASTAMLLARSGYQVLAIDRAELPSDTVSTHAILRSGVLQLDRWGLLDRVIDSGAPPVKEIRLGFGADRIDFEVRAEHGISELYAPRRHLLDRILLDAAREAGAQFRGATRMVDLTRDDAGRVTGIEAEHGGTRHQISARMVIGADGVWSRVAKFAGAETHHGHPPTNAVHYAYFEGIEWPGFWFQFTPGVNAGIIATNDGLSCVFVGRPRDQMPRFSGDPDKEFHRLLGLAAPELAALAANGSRVTPFRGTTGLPGFVKRAHGPGWALVGDAGYTKDPISAHGISDALRDAEICTRAVDRALCDPADAHEAMMAYQNVRDELSAAIFRESEALARYQWGPDEASRRMRIVSEAVKAECEFLRRLPTWAGQPQLV